MSERGIDAITLTVIWNGIMSIAEELGITLRHTAFSEGVREEDDFSTAVFDRQGRMIAQGNFSPGTWAPCPMWSSMSKYFPEETLKPAIQSR